MPRGPKGEKRPADVVGATVMVGRIATGDVTEKGKTIAPTSANASAMARPRPRDAPVTSATRFTREMPI